LALCLVYAIPAFAQNPDSIPVAAAVNNAEGSGPISIFCADLDRDGYLGLAVANYFSNAVSVFRNNGDGTFASSHWVFSGTVKDTDGVAVEGCTLSVAGTHAQTYVTGSDGTYRFYFNATSTDTITPKLNDMYFFPGRRLVVNPTVDSTGRDFREGNLSPWYTTSTYHPKYRKRIDFGTSHDTIPAGYTASVGFPSGTMWRIATNNFVTGNSGLGAIAIQSNKDMWVAYTAVDSTGGYYQSWVVKFTYSSSSWGTPYKVCSIPVAGGGGIESHYGTTIVADKNDILYLFPGGHNTTLYFCKSTTTNPTDSTGWTAERVVDFTITYPYAFIDDQNRIYVEYRKASTTWGYNVSSDTGHTWSGYQTVLDVSGCGASEAVYAHLLLVNNVMHCGWTYVNPYALTDTHAIGYMKGIVDPSTGNISWKKVDGTGLTIPVSCNLSDTILYPKWGTRPHCDANWTDSCWSGGAFYDVDRQGYPHFLLHWGAKFAATASVGHFYYDGTKWVKPVTNLSTSVTPNRYCIPLAKGYPIIDRTDNNIYEFSMVKSPIYEGTAQTKSDSIHIRLETDASSEDNYYRDCYVRIYTGTGSTQERLGTAYNGTAKDLTITPKWTTNPDGTSKVVVARKDFAGEMGLWWWDGTAWSFQTITDKSSYGFGCPVKGDQTLKNYQFIVFKRGWDMICRAYESNFPKLNGDDIRIVYAGREIDRVPSDYWNNQNTSIDFKVQNQILKDKAYDQKGYYWIYYGDDQAVKPKADPDSVYSLYEGFELFYSGKETIGGKRGWISDSAFVTNTDLSHIEVVYDGDKQLRAKRTHIAHSIGTDLLNYEVSVWCIAGNYDSRSYLGLKNNDTLFAVGTRSGLPEGGKYQYYNNSSWADGTATGCPIDYNGTWRQFKIIINSNGCSGYVDDKAVIVNNTTIHRADSLTIGTGDVGGNGSFYDRVIVKKWLANPPTLTLTNYATTETRRDLLPKEQFYRRRK